MENSDIFLIIWFAVSLIPFAVALMLGLPGLRADPEGSEASSRPGVSSAVTILIPIKGVWKGQSEILMSLVKQRYPNFEVLFILEREEDAASSMIKGFCREFSHCRMVISGRSQGCAQKNHNLIAGIQHLKTSTEIIVFCDSGSRAGPDWLASLVRPIVMGQYEVVTTFRVFRPDPPNVAGVLQAIFGSFITISKALFPMPWGGGTAIRRKTFDALRVTDLWENTVVDDMVLGNALIKAGIKTKMDAVNQLDSPLENPSIKTFLNFLERQILFPKFTNPGLWINGLVLMVNMALAALVSWVLLARAVFHLGITPSTYGAMGFIISALLLSTGYWRVNKEIPVFRWLACAFPAVFLGTYVYVRTIFLKRLVWHGRAYPVGKGGRVTAIDV